MEGYLDKINKLGTRVKTLSVWDIDDTLFLSPDTHVYVVAKNKIVKKLTTSEFNKYRLRPGESFDFKEFRDSNIFFHGAQPLSSNIAKAKKAIESKNSMMLVLTARANFNNKNLFLAKFKLYGLDLNTPESHVARAGNLNISSTAKAKATIIDKCLNTKKFTDVHMYDDDSRNLDAFLALESTFKNVNFKAFIAEKNKIKVYR